MIWVFTTRVLILEFEALATHDYETCHDKQHNTASLFMCVFLQNLSFHHSPAPLSIHESLFFIALMKYFCTLFFNKKKQTHYLISTEIHLNIFDFA